MMKTLVFCVALIFSFYSFRRVFRDIRDEDIIEDNGVLVAIALWTYYHYLVNN